MTRKKWLRINKVLRKRNIDPNQVKFINTVRHHITESDEHWKAKCDKCRELFLMKHDYISEVWTLDNKKRIDVLDLIDDIAFEFETDHKVNKPDSKTVYI